MASVKFPMIIATCNKKHVTEIPYTPNAVGKTGGCICKRDEDGRLTDYCYCPEERSYFEWHCAECFPSRMHRVEVN